MAAFIVNIVLFSSSPELGFLGVHKVDRDPVAMRVNVGNWAGTLLRVHMARW